MQDDRVMIVFYYLQEDAPEKRVCSFYTSQFAEWMKMLDYCRSNEIEFVVRDDDEKINDDVIQMLSCGAYVDDVYVKFGTDTCIQCIDVYLK